MFKKIIIILKFFCAISLLLLFGYFLYQKFLDFSTHKYLFILIPFIVIWYLVLGYGFWNNDLNDKDNFQGRILIFKIVVWPGYFIIKSFKDLRLLFIKNNDKP